MDANMVTRLELREASSLLMNTSGARIHPADQIQKLRASLREFGFAAPILIDADGHVLDGNAVLTAAIQEGFTNIPCAVEEYLTEQQKVAYHLTCNRLAECSAWSPEVVSLQLSELESAGFDITLTGFGPGDILLGEENTAEEDGFIPDIPKEAVSKPGDIYQLGPHLLMCGDCTDQAQVHRLMADGKAECVVTDPPYNMNYHGAGGSRRECIENDNLPDATFALFLQQAFSSMEFALQDGGSIYCFYKELGTGTFLSSLRSAGLTFKQELVWVKNGLVLGGAKYQNMYEPILYGCKGKRVAIWNGGRTERSVIEHVDLMNEEELRQTVKDLIANEATDVIRENKPLKSDLHPTMKPVKLLARLIRNSTYKGGIVFDPFGGSGSTLVACEQMGRSCRMMELDPRYVDVIIQRYISLTGNADGVRKLG